MVDKKNNLFLSDIQYSFRIKQTSYRSKANGKVRAVSLLKIDAKKQTKDKR